MKRTLHLKVWIVWMMLMNTFGIQESRASHAMGADLTYQCLGGNTYKITLSFYRDCIGIPAPVNPYVNINSASCGQSLGVTCYARPGTGQEITPACSSAVTTCQGGTFTGIQEWVYDGIVTLPMPCTDWTFGYNLCCRNAAITTITTPGTSTFYIYATLDNTIAPCNSSPTFSNKPVPFLCLGQQYCFNHGANDSDGDSLAYSLITPKQTSTTTVNYIAPYSAANPLNSSPATTFNAFTGDICLTPQALQVTVMAVLVKEYRNGVLIGSVERDMQLTVMNCNNNLPTLSGINGTNNFSMTVCAGQPFCFDIYSNDIDTGQVLSVTWDNGIPGGTFTSTSVQHPVSTFCWTPSASDISSTPYVFTARVADNACPYVGSQIYSYSINVIGITADAGPDQSIACSDQATVTASGSGGTGTYTYLWNTGSTMQSITVPGGTYYVTVSDGICTAMDTVQILTPFTPTAAFTVSSATCTNYFINFNDASTTPGGILNYWHWDLGDGSTSTLQNPVHHYTSPGSYTITLVVGNTLGCYDTLTQNLDINPPPAVAFGAANTCAGQSVVFTDSSTFGEGLNSWNWNFGDGNSSSAENPTHNYSSPGIYTVTLIAGDSLGCKDTAYRVIHVFPSPAVNAGADQTICLGNSVTLTATGGSSYTWAPTGDTSATISVTPNSTTNYTVTVTDSNGCSASDMVTVIINPLPVANAGPDQLVCAGSSVTLTATGGTNYTWTPGGSGSTITVSPGTGTNYVVTITDANGCSASDSVHVSVNPLPTAGVSPDADICAGGSTTLTASGGTAYNWIPTGSNSSNITVSPSSNTTYTVIVSDGNGCSDSADVTVRVHPAPVVSLTSFFICSGTTATLDAGNPGSMYVWSTGETTRTIGVTNGGNYAVTITDGYGCSASSSCNITTGSSVTISLGNVSFCQGDSAVLDAGHPGMIYLWSPNGETTQTITVHTGGTYGVSVTDTSGCSGSISMTAVVNPIPAANFVATNVCAGAATSFTDASSVSSGSITTWNWDFGDGSVSSQQNPSHQFSGAGTYSVTLTIASSGGCSNAITKNVTVNPLPSPDFTFTNACQNTALAFADNSSVTTGNITGYSWNFGDGSSSAQQNPPHVYTVPGNYNVTLQVTTAGGCSNSVTKTVTIYPLPAAAFTTNTACLGSITNFNNTSSIATGSITNYSWDFGDSYTSSQQQPGHTYAGAGSYNVTLMLISSNGCGDTLVRPVTVNPLPVANAGPDQNICAGLQASLTATGGSSYTWSPGGGTNASISVSPPSTSTYTVTVTDVNGCQATDNVTVNVNPLPVANAGPDQAICAGGSVILHATGGLTYSWNPGGSTNSSVTVNPASSSGYVVTVTDVNGCQSADTVTVTVHPLPAVGAGPDQTICSGSTISVSATGAVNYTWNPGGFTTPSIIVTPASSANYVVTGTDVNGCQSSDTMHVTVNPVPVVNIPATLICPGFTTNLDGGNAGSAYQWSTGETSQVITVNDSGTYSVLVTSPNGCSAFGSAYVMLGGSFNSTPVHTSICPGQSTTLNAGNPGCTYQWNTGSTSQSISVNTAGNYTVTITNPNGCTASLLSVVTQNPDPVAAFTAASACLGSANSFTDNSTISSGTVQTYNWDFGDGFSSTLRNSSHNYQGAGVYNVTLTITSAGGCQSAVTQQVTVNVLPVADFSATTVCRNQLTAFSDLSSVAQGSLSSWNWSFGDGSTATSQNPAHTYNSSGSYNVTLMVTTQSGCQNTINKNISVKGLPVAAFYSTNVCAHDFMQFNNVSFSNNGTITGYQWDLGDNTTSVAINPSNAYVSDGTFPVTLWVTSSLGCTDSITHPVTIYPLPIPDFATSPVCQNSPAVFTNHSSVSSGAVTSLYWNFGDGSSSNQPNPSHIFGSNASYNVTLIATTNHQCKDTVVQNLIIHPLPVSGFTAADVCVNTPAAFTDVSTITSGGISTWSWNFGDNSFSSSGSPTHTYSNPGTYSVTVNVTSDYGCHGSYSANLNIFPDPVPAFSAANVCLSNATQFFNQSYIAGGSSFTSQWDFSDGSSSAAASPSHTFTIPGTYQVSLTVTSVNGCSSEVTQNVNVYRAPNVAFTANSGCFGVQTVYIDNSSATDGSLSTWLWQFGDGSSSGSNSPVHMYADSGHYQITLTATTNYGCFNSGTGGIDIYPVPNPDIITSNQCQGTPIRFADRNADPSGNTGYTWNFGDGSTGTDSATSHVFNSAGTFQVTLQATNMYSCYADDIRQVTIFPTPSVHFNAPSSCFPAQVQFTNASTITGGSISTYSWNFGDGSNGTGAAQAHTYAAPGIYNAVLTGTSNNGCMNADTEVVKINPNPQAVFNSPFQGCSPLQTTFTDSSWISSGSVVGWLWDFGDGGVSTQQHPSHLYSQAGSYTITLTIVSDEGCQASITRSNLINVYPSPTASFTSDPEVVDIMYPIVHFGNTSQGYSSYTWNFGDGTGTSSIESPTHTFADTGTYSAQLIVLNAYGCRDTAYRLIEIGLRSTLFAPNCFTPNGDGKNDIFQPAFTQMNKIQVSIFNRWGQLLKSWDTLDGFWDGYYLGHPCQEDVYVYKIKGLGNDGKNYEWTGHVSIVH